MQRLRESRLLFCLLRPAKLLTMALFGGFLLQSSLGQDATARIDPKPGASVLFRTIDNSVG